MTDDFIKIVQTVQQTGQTPSTPISSTKIANNAAKPVMEGLDTSKYERFTRNEVAKRSIYSDNEDK